jgi:hypothetical protein
VRVRGLKEGLRGRERDRPTIHSTRAPRSDRIRDAVQLGHSRPIARALEGPVACRPIAQQVGHPDRKLADEPRP